MSRVQIYDTTLRDGGQTEGISWSVEDKLAVVRILDELGMHYIEGGYAGANTIDNEFFMRAVELTLNNAKLAAFGSTRRKDNTPKNDPGLNYLLMAETPAVALVGKSWHVHVTKVLRTSPEKNLAMIEDSIRFMKSHGKEVIFDAEHFFDGYKENPEYAMQTIEAAVNGGADCVALCDTRGGSLPGEIQEIFEAVMSRFDIPLGIHAHDDAGLAVANTMVAVSAGAVQVQGTFNGYGERCGNANLCAVIPNLKLKMGVNCISMSQLQRLTSASRMIDEIANRPHQKNSPYVGDSAFAHKAGYHVHAVEIEPRLYEHEDPEIVGNSRRMPVSEQSGRAALAARIRSMGYSEVRKDSPVVKDVSETLESNTSAGYHYETALGSFELLVHKFMGDYERPFKIDGFTVIINGDGDGKSNCQATIRMVNGAGIEFYTSDGTGPVDALNKALMKALCQIFPGLDAVHLTDFKVRVLDSGGGTASKVRTLIESTDSEDGKSWGTVGVSEDIIEASWEALVEAIEYKLLKDRQAQ